MQHKKMSIVWRRFFLLLLCLCAVLFVRTLQADAKEKADRPAAIRVNLKENKVYRKTKKLRLTIKGKRRGYVIRYTTNGKRPRAGFKIYKKPVRIRKTTVVKAQVYQGTKKVSPVKKIRIQINRNVQKDATEKPSRESEEKPEELMKGWTVTQYSDRSGSQAMFYTLTSAEGQLIVIDGGWEYNADYVRQVIMENGGVVHAWFLTHPHPDHIGAFNRIYADPQGIVIEHVYDSPVDLEYYDTVDQPWDEIDVYKRYLNITRGADNITHLQSGDVLTFDRLRVEVFHAYEEKLKDMTGDICNNSGLMLKFIGQEDSMLFCADNVSDAVETYLMQKWGPRLKADYVQTAHHGNNSLSNAFYDYVNPRFAFFDAPQWLVEGETYTTKQLMEHFRATGVKFVDYSTAPNTVILL